jgi:hypothetical protein
MARLAEIAGNLLAEAYAAPALTDHAEDFEFRTVALRLAFLSPGANGSPPVPPPFPSLQEAQRWLNTIDREALVERDVLLRASPREILYLILTVRGHEPRGR